MAVTTFPTDPAPSVGTGLDDQFAVREASFGDGYTQRIAKGLNAHREVWRVVWDRISDADKDIFQAFFVARKGSVEAFNWTPPRGVSGQYTAHRIKYVPDNFLTWTVTATFRQEFDL